MTDAEVRELAEEFEAARHYGCISSIVCRRGAALAKDYLRLKEAVRTVHHAISRPVAEVDKAYNTIHEVLGEPPCQSE